MIAPTAGIDAQQRPAMGTYKNSQFFEHGNVELAWFKVIPDGLAGVDQTGVGHVSTAGLYKLRNVSLVLLGRPVIAWFLKALCHHVIVTGTIARGPDDLRPCNSCLDCGKEVCHTLTGMLCIESLVVIVVWWDCCW
jgi:hypothetical protein